MAMGTRSRPNAPPDARRLLRRLRALTAQLEAALLNARALALSEPPPPRLRELTPQEYEVWRRIAHKDEEKREAIAGAMRMSKRNFDKLAASLYAKLGVKTVGGAVRLWVLFGEGGK